MLKIRRPLGRLIFNMGIAIPGKTVFLIETAPRPDFHWKFVPWSDDNISSSVSMHSAQPNNVFRSVTIINTYLIKHTGMHHFQTKNKHQRNSNIFFQENWRTTLHNALCGKFDQMTCSLNLLSWLDKNRDCSFHYIPIYSWTELICKAS